MKYVVKHYIVSNIYNFRESKSSIKELGRLRQDMDVKDIAIEELNSKFIGVEREKNKLKRDLDQSNGEQSKVRCGVMINVGKVIDCIKIKYRDICKD